MSSARTSRKPLSARERARRKGQSAGERTAALRDAKRRQRKRDSFSERGRRLLGTDNREVARLMLAANPELLETLNVELDGMPSRERGTDAIGVVYGDEQCSLSEIMSHFGNDDDRDYSIVNLETEARKPKRDKDIDAAEASGDWSAMEADARVMLAANKAMIEWSPTGVWPDDTALIASAERAEALYPAARRERENMP